MVCGILQYDATLVEFNHVMLNHLYALSIKVTASLEFFTCIGQMMKELAFDDDDGPSNETKWWKSVAVKRENVQYHTILNRLCIGHSPLTHTFLIKNNPLPVTIVNAS